jgi:signal transduction histidine kinase
MTDAAASPVAERDPAEGRGPAPGLSRVDPPVEEVTAPTEGSRSTPASRAFILLRFTLIIAVAYLLIAEAGPAAISPTLIGIFALALLSNVAVLYLPSRWTESRLVTGGVIVGDTVWITLALILCGRFTTEFFYLYFFILFLAAVGESLRLVAIGVAVVCLTYVVMAVSTKSLSGIMETRFLIRIPFLFAVAIFYGYLIDRLRRERDRARSEEVAVSKLEHSHAELERANQALMAEITERRRAEDSLQRANEELQEITDVRSRFFTTISHEVKTPLTAIQNSIKLIRKGANPAKGEYFLDVIHRNAERLNLIITDILDMSRVETGSLRIRAEAVDLAVLVTEVLGRMQARAEAAGVRLDAEFVQPEPRAWADRRRVEQILSDLVDNALRATEGGGSVVVRVLPNEKHVELSVEDTGVGLSTVDQKRVFEPFYQAGDEIVDRPPGAGLGLTICRDLARGHGSELKVESRVGEGSRFYFRLPTDSSRGSEIVEFEDEIRSDYRRYPVFSVLVVAPTEGGGAAGDEEGLKRRLEELTRLRELLEEVLPREVDRFVIQPAHDRIVVVLLTIPRSGAVVVRQRLEELIEREFGANRVQPTRRPSVFGPACYPEDGLYGQCLINVALHNDVKEPEEGL